MAKRRQRDFFDLPHGDAGSDSYNASRELELLSNTPTSTRIILDVLKPYLGQNILEIGAGLGHITTMLCSDGFSVTALEPAASLFQRMDTPENATCLNTTLDDAISQGVLLKSSKFDSALYVNVLEHIANDVDEITSARSMIKDDGTIVIFVPALPRLYGSMDAISSHYRRYRKKELLAVIAAANMTAEKIFYFDSIGVLPYWLSYKVLNKKTLGGSTVKLYDKLVIPTSLALSRITKNRIYGKNLVVIAKKASQHHDG